MADNLAGLATINALVAVDTQTATVNGSGANISGTEGNPLVVLDSTAGGGADHTLDLTIQHRADSDDTWADVESDVLYDPSTGDAATFDQVTNAAASMQTLALRRERLKAEVRAVLTIAGTTPSFTCGVYLVSMPKYGAGW